MSKSPGSDQRASSEVSEMVSQISKGPESTGKMSVDAGDSPELDEPQGDQSDSEVEASAGQSAQSPTGQKQNTGPPPRPRSSYPKRSLAVRAHDNDKCVLRNHLKKLKKDPKWLNAPADARSKMEKEATERKVAERRRKGLDAESKIKKAASEAGIPQLAQTNDQNQPSSSLAPPQASSNASIVKPAVPGTASGAVPKQQTKLTAETAEDDPEESSEEEEQLEIVEEEEEPPNSTKETAGEDDDDFSEEESDSEAAAKAEEETTAAKPLREPLEQAEAHEQVQEAINEDPNPKANVQALEDETTRHGRRPSHVSSKQPELNEKAAAGTKRPLADDSPQSSPVPEAKRPQISKFEPVRRIPRGARNDQVSSALQHSHQDSTEEAPSRTERTSFAQASPQQSGHDNDHLAGATRQSSDAQQPSPEVFEHRETMLEEWRSYRESWNKRERELIQRFGGDACAHLLPRD